MIDLCQIRGAAFGVGGLRRNLDVAKTGVLSLLVQCDAAMQVLKRQGRGQLSVLFLTSPPDGTGRFSTTTSRACLATAKTIVEGLRAEVQNTHIVIDWNEVTVPKKNTGTQGEHAAVRRWIRNVIGNTTTEISPIQSAATA